MKTETNNRLTAIGGESPTNGAADIIAITEPYIVEVTIRGTADFLFHRWNNEAVAEKAAARKGSKAKKTDNVESYVYRTGDGMLAMPGEYLRQSIIGAAKFRQDPRSPRKSAMDLTKAGVISLSNMCSFGQKDWDYEDRRRVIIQRNAITRVRPALKSGWKVTVQLQVNLPEYIGESDLHETITMAGKLIGVGNFRPTFGRFQIDSFRVI